MNSVQRTDGVGAESNLPQPSQSLIQSQIQDSKAKILDPLLAACNLELPAGIREHLSCVAQRFDTLVNTITTDAVHLENWASDLVAANPGWCSPHTQLVTGADTLDAVAQKELAASIAVLIEKDIGAPIHRYVGGLLQGSTNLGAAAELTKPEPQRKVSPDLSSLFVGEYLAAIQDKISGAMRATLEHEQVTLPQDDTLRKAVQSLFSAGSGRLDLPPSLESQLTPLLFLAKDGIFIAKQLAVLAYGNDEPISVGRSHGMKTSVVSANHATFEWQNGRLMLSSTASNGTWVPDDGGWENVNDQPRQVRANQAVAFSDPLKFEVAAPIGVMVRVQAGPMGPA